MAASQHLKADFLAYSDFQCVQGTPYACCLFGFGDVHSTTISQAGKEHSSAIWAKTGLNFTRSFELQADISFNNPDSPTTNYARGDGFAWVFQQVGLDALGNDDLGDLGYYGIDPFSSLPAVEFEYLQDRNTPFGDASDDLEVFIRIPHASSKASTKFIPSTDHHTVTFKYTVDSSLLEVFIDDGTFLGGTVDFANLFPSGAIWGFTHAGEDLCADEQMDIESMNLAVEKDAKGDETDSRPVPADGGSDKDDSDIPPVDLPPVTPGDGGNDHGDTDIPPIDLTPIKPEDDCDNKGSDHEFDHDIFLPPGNGMPTIATLIQDNFDAEAIGWVFERNAFDTLSSTERTMGGMHKTDGLGNVGASGTATGGIRIALKDYVEEANEDVSGAWIHSFTLDDDMDSVSVKLDYRTTAKDFGKEDILAVILGLDGVEFELLSCAGADECNQQYQTVQLSLGTLTKGGHTLKLGSRMSVDSVHKGSRKFNTFFDNLEMVYATKGAGQMIQITPP